MAAVPVLAVYKAILATHHCVLTSEQRALGDSMVRREFRSHRGINDETQSRVFLKSWIEYLKHLQSAKSLPPNRTPLNSLTRN